MSPGCLQPFGVLKILGWPTQSPCSQGAYILLEEGKPTSKYEFLLVIRHTKKIKNKRGRERAPRGGEMCSEKTAPKKKHLSEDSYNKVDPTLSRPGKHSGGGSGQILPQTKQRPPSPLTSNQLSFRQYEIPKLTGVFNFKTLNCVPWLLGKSILNRDIFRMVHFRFLKYFFPCSTRRPK